MFDLYKQLPDCNLEGIQMGITARQWIKIYYTAVFILDPCGTQCELWQHLLSLIQWHKCKGSRRITSGARAAEQSEERTEIQTEYTFPSQTYFAPQWILPGCGNMFSFQEDLILVKLHRFDSPKGLCQLWFTKDQCFWLAAAASKI